jgi:two-component system CheB/CheR fusion protein
LQIVAIGYSAGGLAPLTRLFDDTRAGHAVYFVINHLPADYTTLLPHILKSHTLLKVTFAANGLLVRTGHIYLLPADQYMQLTGNRIRLVPRQAVPGPNQAFAVFLRSLIAAQTRNVIAVFLSGAGNDGSVELSELKTLGATILAQVPSTCEFPQMSENAIATGHVDQILSVAGIAAIFRTL